MINNSILTQIAIAGLAIGIVLTYIQPKWTEIEEIKADIEQTETELKNVTEVNQRLATLYAEVNTIKPRDKEALATYIPEQIDEVKVLKDLYTILELADVSITELNYEGESSEQIKMSESLTIRPVAHSFSFEFVGSYEELKSVLSLLENNNYPLKIHTLSATVTDGGLLSVRVQIESYSRKSKE